MEKVHQEKIEAALGELVSAMHTEFCFSGLATEEQWNEEIAPRLMKLGNVIGGLMPDSPTPRVYKYPAQST